MSAAKRVAYLGPPGTFGEEAVRKLAPGAEHIPYPSHAAVAAAVRDGLADAGVLAIENALTGSVPETLDILAHDNLELTIQREALVRVVHNLVAAPGTTIPDIKVVYTHPAAFGQCSKFLEANLPMVTMEAALSTTAAVQLALKSGHGAAALATLRAAELNGAEVLARDIQDTDTNVTRFLLVGRGATHPTGCDRTSISFLFDGDGPGLLASVLNVFAARGISCSKLESRPTRETFGEYIFLLDFHGHAEDPECAAALDEVRALCSEVKVFGSYPRWNADVVSS